MTDLSKIDFTQLKLEPIGVFKASVKCSNGVLFLVASQTSVAYLSCHNWRLTSGASEFDKRDTDELWARTEQVDEFIKQQSLRRITVVEFAKELVGSEREITILCDGERVTYRFNRDICAFEYLPDGGEWTRSLGMGRRADIVAILD